MSASLAQPVEHPLRGQGEGGGSTPSRGSKSFYGEEWIGDRADASTNPVKLTVSVVVGDDENIEMSWAEFIVDRRKLQITSKVKMRLWTHGIHSTKYCTANSLIRGLAYDFRYHREVKRDAMGRVLCAVLGKVVALGLIERGSQCGITYSDNGN